ILQNYLKYNQQKVAGRVIFASTSSPYGYKISTLKHTRFPDSMAIYIHPKLDKVSFITVMLELLKPFVDPTKIKCLIIVISTEEDKTFDFKIIKETAEAYSVGLNIIGGSAHNIMLDLTWENAASVIFNRIHEIVVNKE
ncbi:15734_t:CDS:2, partial [Funneliformis geosporum]